MSTDGVVGSTALGVGEDRGSVSAMHRHMSLKRVASWERLGA